MKRNTFYVLAGLIALLEVGLFWLSVELSMPMLITIAFIAGIGLISLAKRAVSEPIEDERTTQITQKAALRTLEIFWVAFFAVNLGSAVIAFSRPLGLHRLPPPAPGGNLTVIIRADPALPGIGMFAIMQMALLCLMIFLYAGFRIYYARKYGDWDTDEE